MLRQTPTLERVMSQELQWLSKLVDRVVRESHAKAKAKRKTPKRKAAMCKTVQHSVEYRAQAS
jgi:hypothetical protein